MQFFGPAKWGGALEGAEFVKAPVGMKCSFCDDPIYEDEFGVIMPCVGTEKVYIVAYHKECNLRLIVGSVSHQRKQCMCYGGTKAEDDFPSKRMAALAACELFTEQRAWEVSDPTIVKA
jgi:hypothetical protein